MKSGKKEKMKSQPKHHQPTLLISILSLVVSVVAGGIAWRTYKIAYRPFVGISHVNMHPQGDPPATIIWEWVKQNYGSAPALVHPSEIRTRILKDGIPLDIPIGILRTKTKDSYFTQATTGGILVR